MKFDDNDTICNYIFIVFNTINLRSGFQKMAPDFERHVPNCTVLKYNESFFKYKNWILMYKIICA